MDLNDARKFAALLSKKRELESELDDVKEAMKELEPLVLDQMRGEDMPKLNLVVDGESLTLYPHSVTWVFPGEEGREAVCKALKRARLGDFVREDYNTSTLSAWARERLAEGTPLPPSVEKVVNIEERISLRGRRTPSTPDSTSKKAIKNHQGR